MLMKNHSRSIPFLPVRRESFYWLAILFTFALGTASGDLMAEGLGLGYLTTGLIVATVITATALAWRSGLNSVLSFWIIYILTRPLGASIGDLLSQSGAHGGLGLGATMTSVIFLGGILGTVVYLSITKKDVIAAASKEYTDESKERGGLWQTAAALAIFLIVGGVGYHVRHVTLQGELLAATVTSATQPSGIASSSQPVHVSPLGDLSTFRTITQNTLDLLDKGNQSGATTRIDDLEYEWDNAQAQLKPRDKAAWTTIDGKTDTVLRELRAVHPNVITEKTALQELLTVLN